MRRWLSFLLIGVALVACSGTKPSLRSGKFDVASRSPKAAPSAGSTVVLPAERPPAKVFAGSQSVDGSLSRYCTSKNQCAQIAPAPPGSVSAPSGATLVFTVSAAPQSARVEVRSPSGAVVATRPLAPSPAMYWSISSSSGSYVLELFATYQTSEVAWRFGLTVTS